MSTIRNLLNMNVERARLEASSQHGGADDDLKVEYARITEVASAVAAKAPELPDSAAYVIGSAIAAVYSMHDSTGRPLSPFKSVPNTVITSPSQVMRFLRQHDMTVPWDGKAQKPTYLYVSHISGISKGTLSAISDGRMNFNAERLEQWRNALAIVGKANGEEGLSAFADPVVFLEELLDDYKNLLSTLSLDVIKDWATEALPDMTGEEVTAAIEAATPGYGEYYEAMVNVWREEYVSMSAETFIGQPDFDSILRTRTPSRKFGRGYHKMIAAVHRNMKAYNTDVKYPSTNFPMFKARYSSNTVETGLTADVVIGYCFFLGINPLSVLRWFARNEVQNPCKYQIQASGSKLEDVVRWQGAIGPVEYQKLVDAIISMRLVSDQERWIFALFSSSYVFRNIPTVDDVYEGLGENATLYKTIVEEFEYMLPPQPIAFADHLAMRVTDFGADASIYGTAVDYQYKTLLLYMAEGMNDTGAFEGKEADEIFEGVTKRLRLICPNAATSTDIESRTYDEGFVGQAHRWKAVADIIYSGYASLNDIRKLD